MYASMGGLHLNSIDLFFLGNLLKPMGKPGNTWGHRKYSALKTPLAYAFGFFLETTNACKHMQTRSSTHRSHSEDMTLFSEMYALQGVPMTTLARSIPSIFQK